MGFGNAMVFWAMYFAPSLVAWFRKRSGKPIFGSVGQIFLFNLLLGWSVVGWIIPLANAFEFNPIAWIVLKFFKPGPSGPGRGMPQQMPSPYGSSTNLVSCSQCGGSGTMACSSCGGRGSWYDAPSGAAGGPQLQTCPACTSSGRIRCAYCGGSGRVPGPI